MACLVIKFMLMSPRLDTDPHSFSVQLAAEEEEEEVEVALKGKPKTSLFTYWWGLISVFISINKPRQKQYIKVQTSNY